MVLIAVGQICSTDSMSHNLAQCEIVIKRAAAAGAKAIFLPEATDYIATSPSASLSLCKPAQTSPFMHGLRTLARTHSIYISVGIHEPTHAPSTRLANTLIWLSPSGEILHRYQKLHVFDIDLRPNGPFLRESETTEPGSSLPPPFDSDSPGIELGLGKVGSLICFDLRFPLASSALIRQGAQVLLYPSAFTVPTGHKHWEVLLRARAIEGQCFVVAAAQCGRHNEKRVSYGESLVVGPDGVVLGRGGRVELDEVEGERVGGREVEVLLVEIDVSEVGRVRKGLPLKSRGGVYGVV